MNEAASKTPELLRQALMKEKQKHEAASECREALSNLRRNILAGGTTSNRKYDLAIALKNSLDVRAGSNWFAFEQALKSHPNELLMIRVCWQEERVHRMIGGNDMMECSAEVVCLLTTEPALAVNESFAAFLPVLRYLAVEKGDVTPVIERKIPVTLAMILDDLKLFRAGVGEGFPDPERYFVGNDAVIAELDMSCHWPSASDDRTSLRVLRALGIEHIGTDGQGRLGIPDGSATA